MTNDPYGENSFNSHQHVNVEFTVLHQTHKNVNKGGGVGCFDDLDPCDDIAIKTQIYSNIFKTMKREYGAKNLHSKIPAQAPLP